MSMDAPAPNWKTIEGYHAAADRLARDQNDPDAWLEYGKTREFRNEADAALEAYRRAVELSPDNAAARLALAGGLSSFSPYNRALDVVLDFDAMRLEAAEIYDGLLRRPATRGSALVGLARVATHLGKFSDGFALLEQAVSEDAQQAPGAFEVIRWLPWSIPGRESLTRKLLECDLSHAFRITVMLSSQLVEWKRGDFHRDIERIEDSLEKFSGDTTKLPFEPGRYGIQYSHPFIPYSDYADIPLRKKLTAFFQKTFPGLPYVSPEVQKRLNEPAPEKIRLGFAVMRCMDVDFASLFTNLFQYIDKARFELILLYNDRTLREHAHSKRLMEMVDEAYIFPVGSWDGYCQTLEQTHIDVLFHETWGGALDFSGFARVAPVQCQVFDRLVTLGAPQQDYALYFGNSGDSELLISRYMERSVILPGNAFVPTVGRAPAVKTGKADFDIPDDAKLFLTWQCLIRWRPEDDEILAALLHKYPDAWLLARHDIHMGTKVTEQRWRTGALADVMDRVRFFHYLPLGRLLGLMQSADLVVNSPLETGGVSAYTALGMGIPLVASRAGKVPWNHPASLYDKMNIDGLTARNQEEFIDTLCRLVEEPKWKAEKSAEIMTKSEQIFAIKPYADEMQAFAENAYLRARAGLPRLNWYDGGFQEYP